jgi:hypothetical protein
MLPDGRRALAGLARASLAQGDPAGPQVDPSGGCDPGAHLRPRRAPTGTAARQECRLSGVPVPTLLRSKRLVDNLLALESYHLLPVVARGFMRRDAVASSSK